MQKLTDKRLVDKREHTLLLLETGLVTQSEAAMLGKVTRQCVNRWVKVAGIAPTKARARYLQGLWRVGC